MITEPYTRIKEAWQTTTDYIPKKRSSAGYVKKVTNFIVLPAFNVANTYYGASHIIKKYKYTISSKFSILSLPARPNDTFCLSIVWFGNRYKLWSGIGEILYYPIYSPDKIIDPLFYLEIWNVNGAANALNPSNLTINVSFLTLPDLNNINCDELVGSDKSLSRIETCDNTFLLTGYNPSIQKFNFVPDPCGGVLENL